jgi:transposase
MGKRRRQRRSFTPEFKAEAVKVVQQSGKSVPVVAQELGLTETALRHWVKQAEAKGGPGRDGSLTLDERAELTQLRREVRTLRMERDILKKATAFFAKEQG